MRRTDSEEERKGEKKGEVSLGLREVQTRRERERERELTGATLGRTGLRYLRTW